MFRAWDSSRECPVAVKLFQLDLTRDRVHQLVAELERVIAADLAHPALVAPVATGIHDRCAYLVQDFVAADSLDLVVREFGPAPPADALRVAAQLAGALDFAGVVNINHGALHPRDILLASDETQLTGVGVAQALEQVGIRAPVRRSYSATERIAGGAWDRRADVFGLAALIHELLWGRRVSGTGAHAVESLTRIDGSDFSALCATFARALAEDARVRFDTALDFAQSLKDAFPDVVAAPAPLPKDAQREKQDEPRLPLDEPLDDPDGTVSQPAEANFPMPAPAEAQEQPRYQDVEVAPAMFEVEARGGTGPGPAEVRSKMPPELETEPLLAPLPPVFDRPRSIVGRLALAAIVGMLVGFAGGYGVGTREQRSARSVAVAAPATAPAPAAGREFTEGAVVEPIKPARPPVSDPLPPASTPDPDAARGPAQRPSAGKADSPSEGRLLVRSTPAGARVFVDGREEGRTPIAIPDLSTGAHRVRVTRDGYAAQERRVVVTPGRPAQTVTVELAQPRVAGSDQSTPPRSARTPTPTPVPEPATPATFAPFTGTLVVDSRPAGATVFLDGKPVGTTPMLLQMVRAGEHAVRLEREGYRRWSSSVRVVSSGRNRVTASLER